MIKSFRIKDYELRIKDYDYIYWDYELFKDCSVPIGLLKS